MVSNQKTKKLPFEVGQLAESKSFSQGFRGAWFRCKIMKIKMKKGDVIYDMDFYDFTDDKPSETKLYQIKEKKLHMMVRPRFPPIYRETQMPDTSAISEVIAVVDDIWNVGDLVDWWYDDCYWTGRITHQLGQDKVQIQLLEQPMGEGGSYKALCKDLRPSLDWSLQHGWTVPISSDGEARQCCVRLVHPSSLIIHKKPSQEGKSVKSHATSVSSHGSADASVSAKISSPLSKGTPKQLSDCGLVEKIERPCVIKGLDLGDDDPGKASSSDNVSSTHVQRVSAASENSTGSKGPHTYGRPSKKTRLMEEDYWNSSDPIESSIIDLEELVNKIKWLKRAHQFGFACASAMTPPWKFLEDQPSFRHA